ncbi:MAG: hypothetical protein IPG44_17405 [Anaerolineales bacterium]|nr:hypothetical protein [Anaerolineales bacterium]
MRQRLKQHRHMQGVFELAAFHHLQQFIQPDQMHFGSSVSSGKCWEPVNSTSVAR